VLRRLARRFRARLRPRPLAEELRDEAAPCSGGGARALCAVTAAAASAWRALLCAPPARSIAVFIATARASSGSSYAADATSEERRWRRS
jgi:hypothetical protein